MTTIAHTRTQRRPRPAAPRDITRLLAVSDERDRWHQMVLDAWADGYRAGAAQRPPAPCICLPADVSEPLPWPSPHTYHRPRGDDFVTMDRRCYPPYGRRAWLITRGLHPYRDLDGAGKISALVAEGVAGSRRHARIVLAAVAREAARLGAAS
jgi:hypothetical protein